MLENIMKTTMQYAMAAQCAKCGELFDYSYDMDREEEKASKRTLKCAEKGKKEGLLCWDCRNG